MFPWSILLTGVMLVQRFNRAPGMDLSATFQRQVEAALYGNGYSQQTGAVYRLLQRSGAELRIAQR